MTYANGLLGITALSLRLWSTATPLISTAHLTRVRQMQFRTCA
ncbi:hypothetical protein [Nocardioides sp.]|nr:hypothetical protein [Nocardioides sp.]